MRTYKVTTPTKDFTGEVGGIHFIRGEATVVAPQPLGRLPYADEGEKALTSRELEERDAVGNDPNYRAMAYFRQAGYVVEDVTPEPKRRRAAVADESKPDTPPVVAATGTGEQQGGNP